MSAQQLASIVAQLTRDNGKATTTAVAVRCCVSVATARRWLREVEGVTVKRLGVKRGWLPLAA